MIFDYHGVPQGFVCAWASEYLVACGAKIFTIAEIYAAADLRGHILGFSTDMKFPKAQDSWFTSFSEEASRTGLNIVYSSMIFFAFLSLFLNYSPYPTSLSGDVLSSDFARRVMEFPFVETRYNEMQAYDGVSGDKYIISTVCFIYLTIFLVVMLLFQYLVFVVFAGRMVRRNPALLFQAVCLSLPLVMALLAGVFLLPVADWNGGILKSAIWFTWPLFPIFSIISSLFFGLTVFLIVSGLVKLVLQSFRWGGGGHE